MCEHFIKVNRHTSYLNMSNLLFPEEVALKIGFLVIAKCVSYSNFQWLDQLHPLSDCDSMVELLIKSSHKFQLEQVLIIYFHTDVAL